MALSQLSGFTARKKHVIFKKENDVLFEWLLSVSAWIGNRRHAVRLLQASPAASSEKTQPPFLLPSCMSCPFARILRLRRGFPFTFSKKCDIL